MNRKIEMKEILNKFKRSNFYLGCRIPMGYTCGLPILQVKNDRLCLVIPYLKYKVTGEKDNTLVYPIRYVVTMVLPEEKPIDYKDLAFDYLFSKVDFKEAIGLFRHDAIKHLDKKEYEATREELYACYDKVIAALLFGEEYGEQDEERMRELLQLMIEPCLLPIYKALNKDFYSKYLE